MITFYYGVVGAAKSANLLMKEFDYRQKGYKTKLFKPAIDTRDVGVIRSRVGIQAGCISLSENDLISNWISKDEEQFIFIDECQFLNQIQILDLIFLSEKYNIEIFCYGLKNTYQGDLFPAISKLLAFADNVIEVESVCSICKSKATQSLRILNGTPIYDGDTINIGDTEECEDYYLPVCTHHYFNNGFNKKD